MTELEKLIEETKIKIEEIESCKSYTKKQRSLRLARLKKDVFNRALEKELSDKEFKKTVLLIGTSSCVNTFVLSLAQKNSNTRRLLSIGLTPRDIASLARDYDELKEMYCPICGKLLHVNNKCDFPTTCSYTCNGEWTKRIAYKKIIDIINIKYNDILSLEDAYELVSSMNAKHLFLEIKEYIIEKCEALKEFVKKGFTYNDIFYSLAHNIEIIEHKCLSCGKTIHAHKSNGWNKLCGSALCRIKYKLNEYISSYCKDFDVMDLNSCKNLIQSIKGKPGLIRFGFEMICENPEIKKALSKGLTRNDIIVLILNNMPLDLIKCKVCGKVIHLKSLKGGIINTCSSKCSNEFSKEKREKSCMEKYGVANPFASKDMLDKITNTIYKKYGVRNISQSKTNAQKVSRVANDKSYAELMRNKKIKPLFSREEWKGKRNTYKEKNIREMEYKWECLECGHIFISPLSVHNDVRCPKCGKVNEEQESVYSFLKDEFPELRVVKNDRAEIRPHELDFFIPSLNIGIEYNGDYWHGTKRGKSKYVHYNKYKKCLDKNIKLITIPQNLWLSEKRTLIENKIKEVISGKTIELKDTNFSFINYSEGVNILNKLSLEVINSVSNKDFFISNNSRDFLLVVGRPFFNKRFQWEIKFCSNFNEQYFNSALKIFENEVNPRSIVLYYDLFFGNVDNISNFEYMYHSKPMGVFRNLDISKDFFDYELDKVPEEYFNKDKNFQDKTRNLFYQFNRVFNVGYQVFKKIYAQNEENKP